MHWLKVEREFYNLDSVTKIAYSLQSDKDVTVYIYYAGSGTPQQLKGEDAARFLLTIARLEGCWAFEYPSADAEVLKAILEQKGSREQAGAKKIKNSSLKL